MACLGLRGATTAVANTPEAIRDATRELLIRVIEANDLDPADIASAIFTCTVDLTAEYPAVAARELGWTDTAILCVQEMGAAGSLPRCIRVLIHWNTDKCPNDVRHVYLHAAASLRPDRAWTSEPA